MDLKEGTLFVVVGEDDVMMRKTIEAPGISDFDNLIQVRAQSKSTGLKQTDISDMIKKSRGENYQVSNIFAG